ncbi:MAG: hypothetical protein ACRD2A_18360, partial [Vicinamibacterales bacterium]
MLKAKLTLVESTTELVTFLTWLGERRPVLAIDTETGGLDWWREPLRTVQFGDAEQAFVLPFELWKGAAKEVIENYCERMVFANAKFDINFLWTNGIVVPSGRYDDTMLMGHVISPATSHRLKDMAREYVDPSADDGEFALKAAFTRHGWTWRTVPWDFPAYWHYAALDAVLTARTWEAIRLAVEPFVWVYDLELAVQEIVMAMERRGIRIDLA